MKFMLIMRGTDEAYAAYKKLPFEQILNEMGAYNEAMMTAGVLVAGDGLADDMSQNFVVEFGGDEPLVTDGPYGETHELFNGFWIIEVSGKAEAVEWARRAPHRRQHTRGASRHGRDGLRRLRRQRVPPERRGVA